MIIGVPKEIKSGENRVGLLPNHIEELVKQGHQVYVQSDAGYNMHIDSMAYHSAGATIVNTIDEVYENADMIVKVKEPQPQEYPLMKQDQIIFTYLHAAGNDDLCLAFERSKATGVAYETIEDSQGRLPLLKPMSEVAGRLATQVASKYIHQQYGGKGILLGGTTSTHNGNVVVLGAGVVGSNAADVAIGLGCNVTVLDRNIDALQSLRDRYRSRIETLVSSPLNIEQSIAKADAVIGSVLIPGASAPKIVTKDMLMLMEPGTVIVDVAIDQGGCFETSEVTTHQDPIFIKNHIVHYCVANMPSAVARTSTTALTDVTFPYVQSLALYGIYALKTFPEGLNFHKGKITNRGVATSVNANFVDPSYAIVRL